MHRLLLCIVALLLCGGCQNQRTSLSILWARMTGHTATVPEHCLLTTPPVVPVVEVYREHLLGDFTVGGTCRIPAHQIGNVTCATADGHVWLSGYYDCNLYDQHSTVFVRPLVVSLQADGWHLRGEDLSWERGSCKAYHTLPVAEIVCQPVREAARE